MVRATNLTVVSEVTLCRMLWLLQPDNLLDLERRREGTRRKRKSLGSLFDNVFHVFAGNQFD